MPRSFGWEPIERFGTDNPIWVLKYDMFYADGNFCDKDHPHAVKFTSCHGWYKTEADAIKVLRHFPNSSDYRIEKVHQRVLKEEAAPPSFGFPEFF